MTNPDLGTVAASDFLAHVGETFTVYAAELAPFAADLVDVAGSGLTDEAGRPFSLTFAGGPTPPAMQGIHRLTHQGMGELELFLVPLGPGDHGLQQYEAIFS